MKSQAAELNISKILKRHAAIERKSAETMDKLKRQNTELQDQISHLLHQLEDQRNKLTAANRRADALLSVNETISRSTEEVVRQESDEKQQLRNIISDLKTQIKAQRLELRALKQSRRENAPSPRSHLNSPETVMEL